MAKLFQVLYLRKSIPSSRADAVFLSILGLTALLILLLAADGYLLISYLRPRPLGPVARRSAALGAQDIDQALQALNAREQKLKTLLAQ